MQDGGRVDARRGRRRRGEARGREREREREGGGQGSEACVLFAVDWHGAAAWAYFKECKKISLHQTVSTLSPHTAHPPGLANSRVGALSQVVTSTSSLSHDLIASLA